MDINGCQVVSEPTDKTEEGFSSTVHRGGHVRGPFATIGEAVQCAREWSKESESLTSPENQSQSETD